MNPNPFVSEAENLIREAAVTRLRQLLPDARIIHELNVEQGTVRADIAAVTEERLYLFELKSAKDTLSRLPTQIRHFHAVCHGLVVVADKKWCGEATAAGYPNCDARAIIRFHGRAELWEWPEQERSWGRDWRLPLAPAVPWHHRMLRLLWADELRAIAAANGLPSSSRISGGSIARDLAVLVPGKEIERAVCKALRSRSFAWADPAIGEVKASARSMQEVLL